MNEACSADKVTSNNAEDTVQTDVLIIGAGLAGLTTALALPKSLRLHLDWLANAAWLRRNS